MLERDNPINADCIGTQADRSGSTAVPGGHDHQGAPHPWRRGSSAHTPGRLHGRLRHHPTEHHETAPRRHPLPDRLEHQDDDGGGDPATAQEGKLRLSDPVSKYVPGVPNGNNITIAQLLEMRSGLYNYTNDPIISATIDTDPAKVWTPAELLAIAFAHPPNFPPGTKYEYNNTNYALLGLIIEKMDGRQLATAMQQRLFEPLGMQHTVLPASTVNTSPNRTRTATCTAVPRSRWWANRLTRPRSRLRHELAPSCRRTIRE
jgi:Beta-lactamase